MAKSVNVILAFHAQEPLWDLPAAVIGTLHDEDVRREAVGNDNWVRMRADEGRDIYAGLLDFGATLGAPVCLEATNEILMQVRRHLPATFARLGDAYRSGALYPIYGNAFHTHIAMLTDAELADELRLNREFLRDVMGAPAPHHPGAFPMEGSIDAHKLGGFRRAGMEYVVFPNLSDRKARYEYSSTGNPHYGAFTIGDGLLALPRNFPISQEIWRPITRWQPERLVPQGYILGRYHVLDEEYRSGGPVAYPITRGAAVAQYTGVLRREIALAPDGALLLYIQDLELMDFGEEALDIMGEAWAAVREDADIDLRFVTPDEYIDSLGERRGHVPHLRFHQVSWAPEIRLVLRSDGHYPPLHAGEFRGVDSDMVVFRRWPFIFWEPGRFIADVFHQLLDVFGHDLAIPLTAGELDSAIDDFASLDAPARIAIHMRAMQRACNFGWQPDEARAKWPYMHGLAICEALRTEAKLSERAAQLARDWLALPDLALMGLDRVPEILVDTRVAYLRRGIANLGERAGDDAHRAEAEEHLVNAARRRSRAKALIRQVRAENTKFIKSCSIDSRSIDRVLALVQEHCKELYLAINEIQRAWMCVADTDGMIVEMYDYLYDLYPPLFPAILRELLSDEEMTAIDAPALA